MFYPPIVLFVYNRPLHTLKTYKSLIKNYNFKKFNLYIFADAAKSNLEIKDVDETRKIIKDFKGFKSIKIKYRKKNLVLKKSIKLGLKYIFKKYKNAIILEDDIVVNKYFLTYMKNALNIYENIDMIHSVTAYSFLRSKKNLKENHYLSIRHSSWGWGTWRKVWNNLIWEKDRIKKIINKNQNFKDEFNLGGNDMYHILNEELNNSINSWSIIFDFNCFINKTFCLCPNLSMIKNIGFDGTGVHCDVNKKFNTNIYKYIKPKKFNKEIAPKEEILNLIRNTINKDNYISIKDRIIKKLFN